MRHCRPCVPVFCDGVAELAEPFVLDFGRVECTGTRGVGLACDNDFRL
jgi:hypothetical protein